MEDLIENEIEQLNVMYYTEDFEGAWLKYLISVKHDKLISIDIINTMMKNKCMEGLDGILLYSKQYINVMPPVESLNKDELIKYFKSRVTFQNCASHNLSFESYLCLYNYIHAYLSEIHSIEVLPIRTYNYLTVDVKILYHLRRTGITIDLFEKLISADVCYNLLIKTYLRSCMYDQCKQMRKYNDSINVNNEYMWMLIREGMIFYVLEEDETNIRINDEVTPLKYDDYHDDDDYDSSSLDGRFQEDCSNYDYHYIYLSREDVHYLESNYTHRKFVNILLRILFSSMELLLYISLTHNHSFINKLKSYNYHRK